MGTPKNTAVDLKTGYVLFLPFAEGTKSASVRPFFVLADGKTYRMIAPDSNPFCNDPLRRFHRAFCEVRGRFDEAKDVVSVAEIKETDDPAIPNEPHDQKDRGLPEAPH